jgi:tetratricopeptide (TPR) repeat protein
VRKLRTFLEPLRRQVLPELVGDPETLLVDSTLLEVLHPRQVKQSAGFEGAAWVRWGSFAFHRGDYERASVFHGEALTLYGELGDEHGVAWALMCLGAQEVEQGHHERAKPLFEAALTFSRRLGDRRTVAYALHNLGEVARHSGEYERAKTLGVETLSVFRETDDEWCVARTLAWLGTVTMYKSDDLEAAADFLREGLVLNRDVGNWEWVAYSLENFGALAGVKSQGARCEAVGGGTGPA